jgi:crotonobetainyl-CoA:carnitine CoA-transferase CaiB-like acyl-CoA transferase
MSDEDPNENDRRAGPLSGLRVLELGEGVAAPYCAKLLGDLGADVIKIEDPHRGDSARWRGPFPEGAPDPERSGLFLYLNTSKRSLRLDLDAPNDREKFRTLAMRSDILIEDRMPDELAARGLDYAQLAAAQPRLIVTSIAPYGQTGPHRAHKSQHLNLYHAAGHTSPFAALGADNNRPPSRAGGYLGEYDAGLMAAVGTLAAVLGREVTGRGQRIDASKQEALMALERVTIGRFANEPDPFSGRGPGGLSRAKDGWVMLTTLETHQWEGMLRAMGNPDWANADWCQTPAGRMEHMDEIQAHKDAWGANLTREQIYHLVQAEGTPAAPVRNVAEVLEWPQAHSRGFFRELDHPRAGPLQYPTAPYLFSRSRWVGSRAPLLGEHDEEIFDEFAAPDSTAPVSAVAPNPTEQGPLAGIRVADFTWAWAGPQGSLLLGMLGAEVVKIESQARLDHSRVHSLTAGNLQGGIDASPVFNDLNLGKRSVTLNLRTEKGRELVHQLVEKSDIVLQNMRPGVLDRLGLGYDDLCRSNPDLIMLSSSAVGASGPEGNYAGYAPTFACLSGIASISGHPDEPPISLSGSVDLRVGTASAFAVLAALIHRQRTGEGQNIDISSTEVMSSMMGDAFVGYGLNGEVPQRIGNRDSLMAPHGCFPCRAEGEWITIAVDTELEWAALRALIGDSKLDDARFASVAARRTHTEELDAIVERWTRNWSAADAVEQLQDAGIAAARLHTGVSLSQDPHVLERGVFERIEHPKLGSIRVVRPPWRMQGVGVPGPAPRLGEHNDYVLGSILGLDAAEIAELEDAEAVY